MKNWDGPGDEANNTLHIHEYKQPAEIYELVSWPVNFPNLYIQVLKAIQDCANTVPAKKRNDYLTVLVRSTKFHCVYIYLALDENIHVCMD